MMPDSRGYNRHVRSVKNRVSLLVLAFTFVPCFPFMFISGDSLVKLPNIKILDHSKCQGNFCLQQRVQSTMVKSRLSGKCHRLYFVPSSGDRRIVVTVIFYDNHHSPYGGKLPHTVICGCHGSHWVSRKKTAWSFPQGNGSLSRRMRKGGILYYTVAMGISTVIRGIG